MTNLCINCKHHIVDDFRNMCIRDATETVSVCPVLGGVVRTWKGAVPCNVERGVKDSFSCGPEGKFFIKRPWRPKQDTVFRFILGVALGLGVVAWVVVLAQILEAI